MRQPNKRRADIRKEKQTGSCGVLTISDRGSRGERRDTSGPALKTILAKNGFEIVAYKIIPDCEKSIKATLIEWTDERCIDLIVTTGGTGVSPTDVTPEATRAVTERELPGISEIMRQASFKKTVNAVLSRGIAGIRKESLIINVPGSEKAARENIETILKCLPHAVYKIKGGADECSITNDE